MNSAIQTTAYSRPLIAIHWLTALLIAVVFGSIELRGLFERGSDAREAMKALHFMLGLSVFALVFVRLVLKRLAPVPVIFPKPAAWQRISAGTVHALLYGFMIAMPLLGWLMLSAGGKPIPFFGLSLPPLVAENKDLATTLKEIHEAGGNILYFIIGLHAVGALAHHYVFHDNTLARMVPALSVPRR